MSERRLPREYNRDLRRDKLEQVILFFLHHANNDLLGKTKLMKLLYYADFDHYERHQQPITGARYRKLPHGPVPDEAWEVLDALVADGRTRLDVVPTQRGDQHRYRPIVDVDTSVFAESELVVLNAVAERWSLATTEEIEQAAHDEPPWVAVHDSAVIPYHLAFYRNTFGGMDMDDEFLTEGIEALAEIVLR